MIKIIDEYKKLRPDAFMHKVICAVHGALPAEGRHLPDEIHIPGQDYETLAALFENDKIENELREYDITMCHIDNDYFFIDTLILPTA